MSLNTTIGPERVEVDAFPLGTVQVPGAGLSTASFLISTTMMGATVNTPTAVQTLDDFETDFGTPDQVSYGAYYAVKGYFDNAGTGSTAIIVNVGSSPTAASFIGTQAAASGLHALDAIDDVGMITVPGLPLTMAYEVQPALIDYSKTVRTEFGSNLSTAFSLLAVPAEVTTSSLDKLVVTAPSTGITGLGPYVVGLNLGGSAVAASGSLTIINYLGLTGGAFFHIGANLFTEGVDFTAATDNNTTASAIATAINTAAIGFTATATNAVVAIVANTPGSAGNVALTSSEPGDLMPSASTLTGGADASGAVSLANVTPGMIATDPSGANRFVISAVGVNSITVITNPSSYFGSTQSVLMKMPSAVTYKEDVVNDPSMFAAWYYNWLVVTDLSASATPGEVSYTDPVGHVAGIMARIDANTSIGGVSHAPAGIRYAGVAGIVGLALSISERLDAGPLRLNFINRITSFPGSGNIVFGGYTADSGTSPAFTPDEQLIQVMRTLQFIKASLEPGLRSYIWENYSPVTMSQISSAITSFLRNNIYLFPAGLPESQKFNVISVTPTQDDLNQGLLKVRVQVRPNQAVRFIEIDLEYPIPVA